eukprot:TRINITY_DN4238_c0_g1_i2.p1 TRINITY_DN4238_c0_g1~~TRINITY_DN4238_c0_g1_i2.p1  ORF type:complete len:315 (-),score=60.25 TRINITY_DN4238_c0_g1_i2:604-1548(-)
MLNCRDELTASLVGDICKNLRSEEDFAIIQRFGRGCDFPDELTKFLDWFEPNSMDVEMNIVEDIYKAGTSGNDAALLHAAKHLLSVKCRQGSACVAEVATMLSRTEFRSNPSGLPITLQFLDAHPEFYKRVVEGFFAELRSAVPKSSLLGFETCSKFLDMCVKHVSTGRIDRTDLEYFVEKGVKRRQVDWFRAVLNDKSVTSALAAAFRSCDVITQRRIVKILVDAGEFDKVVDNSVVTAMALEAKAELAAGVARIGHDAVRHFVTRPVMQAFDRRSLVYFLPTARHLDEKLKEELIAMTFPEDVAPFKNKNYF